MSAYPRSVSLIPYGLRRANFSGPPYCNDVAIDKDTGLAFLACDPFKPSFYPPYELSNLSRVYGSGGIWLYDTDVFQFVLPR